MGIQDLQEYVETGCPEACKPVDLLKIARGLALSKAGKRRGPNNLCLVVDGESCLDRLYGGYYSDWACGGQWNRMTEFLNTLVQACHSAHMDIVIFFDGSMQNQNIAQWHREQLTTKRNACQVFKHINNKATPPPKVWWVAPMCLRSALRLAFRHLGVKVASSMDDHRQEVIGFCRDHGYHGVLAHSADYIMFDPPRYFSSEHLKLTYKGALETTEYVHDDIAKLLDLHPKRFCVLGALLGSHILSEHDLEGFLKKVSGMPGCDDISKVPKAALVKGVVGFVRSLESVDDLDAVGTQVFEEDAPKIAKFKASVQYFMNGTHEGYMRYRPKMYSNIAPNRQPGSYPDKKAVHAATARAQEKQAAATAHVEQEDDEEEEEEEEEKPLTPRSKEDWGDGAEKKTKDSESTPYLEADSGYSLDDDESSGNVSGAQLGGESPQVTGIEQDMEDKLNISDSAGTKPKAKSTKPTSQGRKSDKLKVPPEVMRIASDRHQKGLMHPWVYQMLSQGEVKIDVSMEDENNRELPPITELYRPIRQNVFSILFDLNKQWAAYRKTIKSTEQRPEKPDITYKEWIIPKGTPALPQCEVVHAEPLDWLAPGIHRLWLGQAIEDKNRRLRAFLSCMNSDVPYMLNTSYVPQHMIMLCATLRYLVLYSEQRVLRKHELDAFLATAVSPLLHDVETMQEMKLPLINSRGVQLGAIMMRGIEHAVFANDGVGSPIPWHMCCPWHFFDGKLFHFKLLKANNNTPLIDICDGHVEQMMRVERMRQAILQGVPLDLAFAKPALPAMAPQFGGGPAFFPPPHHPGMNMRPGAPPHMGGGGPGGPPLGYGPNFGGGGGGNGRGNPAAAAAAGRGRGLLGEFGTGVDARGGQLQIAGVVVGNWGPNTHNQHPPSRQGGYGGGRGTHLSQQPPHVMNVGGQGPRSADFGAFRGSRGGVVSTPAYRGGRGTPKTSSRGGPPNRMQQQMSPNRLYNEGNNFYNSNNNYNNNFGSSSGGGGNNYNNSSGGYGNYNNSSSGYGNNGGGIGGGQNHHSQFGSSNSSSGYGNYNNSSSYNSYNSNGGGRGGGGGGGMRGNNQRSSGGPSTRSVGNNRPFPSRDPTDLTQVTLEQRSRSHSGGAGRGCTVENPMDSNIVSVHELMTSDLPCADSAGHLNGSAGGVEISTFADVDAELAMVDSRGSGANTNTFDLANIGGL